MFTILFLINIITRIEHQCLIIASWNIVYVVMKTMSHVFIVQVQIYQNTMFIR
jgi:hypothetical protein